MLFFLLDSQENYKNIFIEKDKKLFSYNNTYSSSSGTSLGSNTERSSTHLNLDVIQFHNLFFIEKFINLFAFLSNFFLFFIDNNTSNKRSESSDNNKSNNFNITTYFSYLSVVVQDLDNSTSFEFRIFLFLIGLLATILVLIAYSWRIYSLHIQKYLIHKQELEQLIREPVQTN